MNNRLPLWLPYLNSAIASLLIFALTWWGCAFIGGMPSSEAVGWATGAMLISALALFIPVSLRSFQLLGLWSRVIGLAETMTGDDLDGNGDVGNDGPDDKDGIAWLYKPSGAVRMNAISQNDLNRVVLYISRSERFPEASFLGNGKMFRAGQRAQFEAMREELVKAGLIIKRGTGSSPYERTADGERLALEHLRQAYAPHSPSTLDVENPA